jgi:hypothetical protein
VTTWVVEVAEWAENTQNIIVATNFFFKSENLKTINTWNSLKIERYPLLNLYMTLIILVMS